MKESSIEYKIGPDGSPGNLFFERDSNIKATSKYFKKTTVWEHEKEFRIIISLGGKQVIKLNNNIIKSIYLGCNMNNEKIKDLKFISIFIAIVVFSLAYLTQSSLARYRKQAEGKNPEMIE